MFHPRNIKQNLFKQTGRAAFEKQIAPKIAAHVHTPIEITISGENKDLNTWLVENLRLISAFHIMAPAKRLRRPANYHQQREVYE